MPTIVHFVGAEQPITVADDYGFVGSSLKGRDEAQFKLLPGDNWVTVYKTGVAYIEMVSEGEILSPGDLPA